jgi:tRNA-2-methylthio-N6-dimethylallyladenosine synthase
MQKATAVDFAKLLDMVAIANPKLRIRFSTSNPQDMSLEVIYTMAKHKNICKHLHLPVQSGSNRILKEMNRQHTREEYMKLTDTIYKIIPEIAMSQDMIIGFPTETEKDHQDTLDLINHVKYDYGFMFSYSERPGTLAGRKMEDDVPFETKKRRLQEVIDTQRAIGHEQLKKHLGKIEEVLIEKTSKKSDEHWAGRNTQSNMIIFPKENYNVGDFVNVRINDCTTATFLGEAVGYSNNN